MKSSNITFKVTAQVFEGNDVIGEQVFEFNFPRRDVTHKDSNQVSVNNVSETQTLCGDIAKQAALSATWKAATVFVDRQNPELVPMPIEDGGGAD